MIRWLFPRARELPIITAPERFRDEFVKPALPVIIRGAIEDWPARRLWSADYFAGSNRTVPIARTSDGRLLHDGGMVYEERPLSEWNRNGYVMLLLHEWWPELAEDLRWPAFLPDAPWSIDKLWLSAANVRSPLHQDLPDNLFAQIAGRKQVTLFSPRDSGFLYRHPPWSKLPQVSRVDSEAPDRARFPNFPRAQPLRAILEPGDLLYIPRLWWHQMRSLDFSISVNHWWATGLSHQLVRAALFYQKLRKLRY